MKYFSWYTPDPTRPAAPPCNDDLAKMNEFMAESIKAGTLLATGGLMPIAQGGACVRRVRGQISVVDGPFAEAKEVIAGWAILEAKSREDAIAMTQRFIEIAGDGECHLRQIMDAPHGI